MRKQQKQLGADRISEVLHESEQLINELKAFTTEPVEQNQVQLEENLRREAQRRFRSVPNYGEYVHIDGYVEISLSDDGMAAYADFYPPSEGMQPLALDEVYRQIDECGVTHGVDHRLIKDCLMRCNLEHTEVSNVLIARGTPPSDEVPEHLVPDIQAEKLPTAPRVTADERVDFRALSPYVLVSSGERVAHAVPLQRGVEGRSVRGETVPYGRRPVRSVKAGANTTQTGEGLFAASDGILKLDGDTVNVEQVLVIDGDVDYHTGHIEFPGDIVIRGQIKDGFQVHAGGSIYCENTMDASDVVAGGDLVISRGLIGRRSGTARVGGSLQARFIENCFVEAQSGVRIEAGILNSQVYTKGTIEVGPRGIVVGGRLYAQQGCVLTHIGTEAGPKTEVSCGTDYAVEQKLDWIREQSARIAAKLKEIRVLRHGAQHVTTVAPSAAQTEPPRAPTNRSSARGSSVEASGSRRSTESSGRTTARSTLRASPETGLAWTSI